MTESLRLTIAQDLTANGCLGDIRTRPRWDRIEAAPSGGGTPTRGLTHTDRGNRSEGLMKPTPESATSSTCIRDDCAKPEYCRGVCQAHYSWHQRRRTLHELPPVPRISTHERFWIKVDKSGSCWLWTSNLEGNGYGTFRLNGKDIKAHRLSYQWLLGPIPDGLVIDHICRVRNCVRPEHLRAITNRENVAIGVGISAIHARQTHCVNGHPFDEVNTIRTTKGHRRCRECANAANRRWRQREASK